MNSDVFFDRGTTHKVCQDYAEGGDGYVIVSDGCSTATNTDFGSRILVRSAAQNLGSLDINRPEIFGSRVIASSGAVCRTLAMKSETLRATLLLARVDQNRKTFSWAVFGDGVVVRKYKKEGIRVQVFSQPSNAPPYLAYCLTLDAWENYKKEFGHRLEVKDFWIRENGIEPGPIGLNYQMSYDQPESILEPYHPIYFAEQDNIEDYDWIALCSDGVEQFLLNHSGPPVKIPVEKILWHFMSFKGFAGEFVQRRASRAMKEIAEKEWTIEEDSGLGSRPSDDVSVGVLSFA